MSEPNYMHISFKEIRAERIKKVKSFAFYFCIDYKSDLICCNSYCIGLQKLLQLITKVTAFDYKSDCIWLQKWLHLITKVTAFDYKSDCIWL